ncbi:uncharacterized protein LOC126572138 [Anopheles aquasalis]|uniref:uncharacterized protein LOC126572138 n=1 Tax=Anopheles aquasalis TaxID=42839 RepID=UPI00215A0FE8|nr:uncharacterized protein LOC126572138 [Anopheles aquasalis]
MPLAVEGAFCEPLSVAATMETPGKKRKRNAETNPFLNFTDQTFSIPSSTPKHSRQIDGSAFENPSFRAGNKENYNIFSDSCMEVKSIADLAAGNRNGVVAGTSELNPFEVIRKPPKKKKKQHESGLEESCFENPCLNLAAADKKPVNPFEVVRDGEETKRQEAEDMSRCFVNSALNIRNVEVAAPQQQQQQQPYNPFEIVRSKEQAPPAAPESQRPVPDLTGIENPALEVPTYAIAVPFTPSLKHRINFQELPASALTPCHLMASMAVCSPIHGRQLKEVLALAEQETPKRNVTITLAKRRSLSVISEESDIGEKLDCYQLELENSMNEAKAKRQQAAGEGATAAAAATTPLFTYSGTGHRRRSVRRSLIDMKHISNLSLKLRELEDEEADVRRLEEPVDKEPDEEEEDKENKQPLTEEASANELKVEKTEESAEKQSDELAPNEQPNNQITFTITKETTVREEIRIDVSNPDVQFEEVDDFEDEEQDVELMHNPAPFQRAYRKKEPLVEQPRSLAAGGDDFKCPTSVPEGGKSHKVRDAIRRSFRRLIPRHQSATVSSEEPKAKDADHEEGHGHGHGHGLISSIRHSLRRRQPKAASSETVEGTKKQEGTSDESPLEMSIIAEQPRAVYRQPALNEYKPIAANPAGAVGSTLRSSLRRSTKDIRKQMMKSVFRKQTPSGDLLAGDNAQHRDGQLV